MKNIYYVKAVDKGNPEEYFEYLVMATSVTHAKNIIKDKFSVETNYRWSAWALISIEDLQSDGYVQI